MVVRLTLPDGSGIKGVRPADGNWLLVEQRIGTGQRFILDGIERMVAAVIGIPPSNTAVQFLPDFSRPECRPCAALPQPPSADACLSKTDCPLRAT
jgi:hypothetical protein